MIGQGAVRVLLVNGLGDQLIALPAVRAIASLFPGRVILTLGYGMRSFFYGGVPLSGDTRIFWKDRDVGELDLESLGMAEKGCDTLISLCTWDSPSMHAIAARDHATLTVGLCPGYDVHVRRREEVHMFEQIFDVPRALDTTLAPERFDQPPRLSSAARAAADRLVQGMLVGGEKLLVVHPETRPEKMWTQAGLARVLRGFLAAHREYRALVWSVNGYPLDLGPVADRVEYGDAHLELALATLRHASLFLGVDSCFLHAADLWRVPGVGLFGPTGSNVWGFHLSPRAQNLDARGPMDGHSADRIIDALAVLAAPPSASEHDRAVPSIVKG